MFSSVSLLHQKKKSALQQQTEGTLPLLAPYPAFNRNLSSISDLILMWEALRLPVAPRPLPEWQKCMSQPGLEIAMVRCTSALTGRRSTDLGCGS